MGRQKREKNLTVLGKESVFDGVLKFRDDLKIDGSFTGAIDAKGNLEILKGAVCRVQYIKAASIVVEGDVAGNMMAIEKIDLKNGSKLRGDITTGKLRIDDDVEFEGRVKMISDNVQVEKDIFSLNAEQLKEQMRIN
ncbi:MAG: hypothetical protein CR988_05100 [Treponema sp.]|nr:MAG: hypothetical protein CR988_05100 [Treponema sp.]